MTTPEAASLLPLQGAPPAAWRSQIRGGCLVPVRTASAVQGSLHSRSLR